MKWMRQFMNEQTDFEEPKWRAKIWDLDKDKQKNSTTEIQNKKWLYKYTRRGGLYENTVQLSADVNTVLNTRIALRHPKSLERPRDCRRFSSSAPSDNHIWRHVIADVPVAVFCSYKPEIYMVINVTLQLIGLLT
jgi:hypothetical protein